MRQDLRILRSHSGMRLLLPSDVQQILKMKSGKTVEPISYPDNCLDFHKFYLLVPATTLT